MPTPTYDLIASNVLGTDVNSLTFTSITASYRDLVVVAEFRAFNNSFQPGMAIRLNNNTGSIYSTIYMGGNGSSTFTSSSSGDDRSLDAGSASSTESRFQTYQIMDYSATDKHKTILCRSGRAGADVFAEAIRFASTSAVNEINLLAINGRFNTGSSFYLYGIVS
jgi:hypothetical protein